MNRRPGGRPPGQIRQSQLNEKLVFSLETVQVSTIGVEISIHGYSKMSSQLNSLYS